jgi:plasmid stabilization system protein ParE
VRLRYDPGAEEDYLSAIEFYQELSSKAASQFVKAVEETEDRILAAPESYPFLAPEIRTLRVPRFPFSIVYRYSPEDAEIFVAALWHMSRHPGYFRKRLSPE